MKKILIPTDFSTCATFATNYGIKIAATFNSKLEFLHVISTPFDWVKIPLEHEKLYPDILERIRIAKNELDSLKAKSKLHSIESESSLVFDIGIENIVSYINASDYDLIILGTNGSSGVKEKVLGSNAQKVIRKSTVPVLVLKKEINYNFSNVVFVSDFKDLTPKALKSIFRLIVKLNSNIHLLYIRTNEEVDCKKIDSKMEEVLNNYFTKVNCFKHIIEADSIEQGVIEFSKKDNIDLVSICTHGKIGLKQLFTPSVTEHIANHIELPLLSVKL